MVQVVAIRTDSAYGNKSLAIDFEIDNIQFTRFAINGKLVWWKKDMAVYLDETESLHLDEVVKPVLQKLMETDLKQISY